MKKSLATMLAQKTAYEIMSGDWSSDVCSSDLLAVAEELVQAIAFVVAVVAVAVAAGQQLLLLL